MSDAIYVTRDGPIATVVLNRPEKLNAISMAMSGRLREIMEACDQDPDLRCIVLRGTGGRAFSVGADIAEFEATRSSAAKAREYARVGNPAFQSVRACRHPVIALIQGLCVGGGFGLAALCDLKVSGDSSRFGVPIKRLGLVESHEDLEAVVRSVGAGPTLEILLTGDLLDAPTALRIGFVNRVVADDRVEAEAYAMARKIAEGAPLAARWHKRFVYDLVSRRALTEEERDVAYHCFDTEDFQIGYRAFLAKTTPRFVGR
ncbi:MAG TPA: enoyl-CoA hydratase-related protein [Methylomirabilota bacterium]|jgi:enoyl-CoA hydratase/carnithine racemase